VTVCYYHQWNSITKHKPNIQEITNVVTSQQYLLDCNWNYPLSDWRIRGILLSAYQCTSNVQQKKCSAEFYNQQSSATANGTAVVSLYKQVWIKAFVTLCLLADGNVMLLVQCCACLSPSVTWNIVPKRCILEQKLLLTAYIKSYIRNRLVPKWMTLTFV